MSEKDNYDINAGAVKYDDKKLRWDLVPISAFEELVYVYTVGAIKYADRNWERGFRWGRSFAAIIRHACWFWKGRDKDPELQAYHLAQAAWNALALLHFALHPKKYKKWDDRPSYGEQPENPEDRLGEVIKMLKEKKNANKN